MRDPSPLNVGDSVDFGDFVGIEGTTGHSTGIHLHISSQDMTGKESWTFGLPISKLLNPCDYMGFPNVLHTSVIYYGTPKPPQPQPTFHKKRKFKWVLYVRKLREKRNI